MFMWPMIYFDNCDIVDVNRTFNNNFELKLIKKHKIDHKLVLTVFFLIFVFSYL